MAKTKEELKAQILELTREYYSAVHAPKKDFVPGKTHVNYGGRYFDDQEVVNLVDSVDVHCFSFGSTITVTP